MTGVRFVPYNGKRKSTSKGDVAMGGMIPNHDEALTILDVTFGNFDKWETYGDAFSLVDQGIVTLLEVMDAGHKVGITPSVIAMRRRQFLAMR